MAKLNELTDQILNAAKEQALNIKKESEEQHKQAMEKITARGKQDMEIIVEDARKEAERITSRAISSASQKNLQDKLSLKFKLIEETISMAYTSVLNADTDVYMEKLCEILTKKANFIPEKGGEIVFNKKDKQRLTPKFSKHIKKLNLTVSDESKDIDGGFILRLGNIEENCSIEAIFRENHDMLVDFIGENLF
ncbi:MAG: V-type ATP synthase subunit E [Clostridia bacterium]|nr:V-type ATP synthase subunit E [Clostridia bacterium]